MTYDETYKAIKRLTKPQRKALDAIMINKVEKINFRTAKSLSNKGLIIIQQIFNPVLYEIRYGYTISTHYVWCEICSEEYDGEENADL